MAGEQNLQDNHKKSKKLKYILSFIFLFFIIENSHRKHTQYAYVVVVGAYVVEIDVAYLKTLNADVLFHLPMAEWSAAGRFVCLVSLLRKFHFKLIIFNSEFFQFPLN